MTSAIRCSVFALAAVTINLVAFAKPLAYARGSDRSHYRKGVVSASVALAVDDSDGFVRALNHGV